MTLLETLYMKDVANESSFLLVTHMTSFDIQINRYEFLNQISLLHRCWID
jgi:hypothetical protein